MSDESPKRGLYFDNVVDENIDSQTILRQKNDRMIRNTIGVLFLSILILVLVIVMGVNPQKMTGTLQPSQPEDESFVYNNNLSQEIDLTIDPLQTPYAGELIIRKIDGEEFKIMPLAKYEISALVVGMKPYSPAVYSPMTNKYFVAQISPVDLCLAWGKLADPEYDKYMTYPMSITDDGTRMCRYLYKEGVFFYNLNTQKVETGIPKEVADTLLDSSFLRTHNSNNHIIPANENVHNAIKNIKNKEKVVLKGFLVEVYQRGQRFLKTSLIRTDDDCEVFYVTKVRIGNNIYE